MAKTNHIDNTRPAPISMNESTTVYRLEFLHEFEIVYKYFVIQNMEILGIKPKQEYFCDFKVCLAYYISVQYIEYANQQVQ